MTDTQPPNPLDDDFEDVIGDETDFPVDEYRLSTRPAASPDQ
ncbi:hypothetical protein [Streptomyces bobili]|nr:hypothetical protein [Streptomyces bobili]